MRIDGTDRPGFAGVQEFEAQKFVCAYCGSRVASEKGWKGHQQNLQNSRETIWILLCPECGHPTYWNGFTILQMAGPNLLSARAA